ncbi:hypothetical protein TVAG_340680 [Trichomonas vaginalis G3]|uniref:LisH domain-containing protein n=1 Tax=Trichomonas vaginalis (strain ATCC PRA-98 / G3) TaxID=412133 RepID=A2DTM7_TRIV3|nr:hypothetical protein TVAGG3_1037910 [Trichomonas vaginalis G3]EAY16174.1 hypothetical protein TVAG_340680 [Trichomonas vaginalis G3]KAI5493335.1 hypothetical protein TVAGG3_1037910 [Trichomonas vaginalis G3]|eukprot:XP_001328397.1 hypothetical protein [Trichomonas vaginalis G3]
MSTGDLVPKQEDIDEMTKQVVVQNGGHNYLYAEYLRMTANLASESDETFLNHFQPNINYDKSDIIEALKYVMAYLKANKMKETLNTLRIEYPDAPTKTGYSTRSEVAKSWDHLNETIRTNKRKSLDKKVRQFSEEIGLPVQKHSRKPTH